MICSFGMQYLREVDFSRILYCSWMVENNNALPIFRAIFPCKVDVLKYQFKYALVAHGTSAYLNWYLCFYKEDFLIPYFFHADDKLFVITNHLLLQQLSLDCATLLCYYVKVKFNSSRLKLIYEKTRTSWSIDLRNTTLIMKQSG